MYHYFKRHRLTVTSKQYFKTYANVFFCIFFIFIFLGTTTIALAVVLTLLAVALIVFLAIFFYQRYKYTPLEDDSTDM